MKPDLPEKPFLQKIQYLWDYYKLPFIIIMILAYIIFYLIWHQFSDKEILLYVGNVNLATSEELTHRLTEEYLSKAGLSREKVQIQYYTGWYLTDDTSSPYYEYTYGSQMKILGVIDEEQLDIVFLNREAFDAFSQNGYLYDVDELLKEAIDFPDEMKERISSSFVQNMEIVEDNAKEIALDPSTEYHAITSKYMMGIDLSDTDFFNRSTFSDTVYLGILKNTPRTREVLHYLEYLFTIASNEIM